jgi:hypothetical protein
MTIMNDIIFTSSQNNQHPTYNYPPSPPSSALSDDSKECSFAYEVNHHFSVISIPHDLSIR